MIILKKKPNKLGTAVFTLTFTDEDGVTVVPISLQWQLQRNSNSNVINSRSFANSSFSGNTIVLSGNDLQVFPGADDLKRTIGIQGVYTSSAGSDLPIKEEATFSISNLIS